MKCQNNSRENDLFQLLFLSLQDPTKGKWQPVYDPQSETTNDSCLWLGTIIIRISKVRAWHHASRLGWSYSACKPTPFSSKHNDGHYGQTVLFLFHQTREYFSKKYDLCPHVQLQTVVWLIYEGLGAVASSLLSGISVYVDIGLILLWILQNLHKVLCCCSGIDLHSMGVSFLCGMTAAWSHGVYTCILLFVQMNVLPSGVWKLLPRMNQTVKVYNFFSEVLADFFWFSHYVKQRGTEFEGRPWNTSPFTPPIDSNDVN